MDLAGLFNTLNCYGDFILGEERFGGILRYLGEEESYFSRLGHP